MLKNILGAWTLAVALLLAGCNEGSPPTAAHRLGALSAQLEILPTPGAKWTALHGMTAASYQTQITNLSGQGYRVTYVSGYELGGQERFAALFEKSTGPAWLERHGMTSAQYQTEANTQVANGYRLVLVNGYAIANQPRFVALWLKTGGPAWSAAHGMDRATYQSIVNAKVAAGFRVAHVSGYTVNNQDFYAAIFSQQAGPAWTARHAMSATQFQQELDNQGDNGFQLTDVSGYSLDGQPFYAAVWEQLSDRPWKERHSLTASQYQTVVADFRRQGYRPTQVCGFGLNGSERFVAVFKNFNYTQDELNALDAPMWSVLFNTGAPSISVAISKNGRLVYAKALGLAVKPINGDAQVEATAVTRYRIMSISKSITATAIERMKEKNMLMSDLSNRLFGPGTGLFGIDYGSSFQPGVTSITVKHLLTHSSGAWGQFTAGINRPEVGIYCYEPAARFPSDKSLSFVISSVIANCPLDRDSRGFTKVPGQHYDYSNFGYAVLGRVIERLGQTDYQTWVRGNVLAPMGITNMVIGKITKAERQADEAVYYDDADPSAPYTYNMPRNVAPSGWIATPSDLARFATYVDGKDNPTDIFSQRPGTWQDMVKASGFSESPTAAKGWFNDGVNAQGVTVIWNAGYIPGTLSLLQQTSDGYTLAAITNGTGRISLGDLGTLLGQLRATAVNWTGEDLY